MQDKNVWLYTRVSRDEDGDFDSIENQQKMLRDFAKDKNLNVIGESSDNNVSGMTFIRQGLDEMNQAIDKGLVQLILVKDMSRLGRRQSMTALYIDELTEKQVEVFSVTENISTFNENDSLIIGFKGLINDSYSRDLSRKIYSGFKQRQKDKGVVIIPPFGYIKDKNNNEIVIVEECADIIRLIFNLFIDGMGVRKISQYLTENGYMPPSYYQKKFYDKGVSKNRTNVGKEYIWYPETVSRILCNKSYIGILECNKTYRNSIKKIKVYNDEKDYIIHEDYFPKIVTNNIFESAQAILNNRKVNNVRATTNQKIHRYAGLIECVECGANFTAKKRKSKSTEYVDYVCNTYTKRGKEYCSTHRIKEAQLDKLLFNYIENITKIANNNIENINKMINNYDIKNTSYNTLLNDYQNDIDALTEENKGLVRQSVKYPDREEMLNEMIDENNRQIKILQKQIDTLKKNNEMNSNVSSYVLSSIEKLNNILKNKSLSNGDVQMIVKKIYIHENSDGTLDVKFDLNTSYSYHLDIQDVVREVTLSCVSDTTETMVNVYKIITPLLMK